MGKGSLKEANKPSVTSPDDRPTGSPVPQDPHVHLTDLVGTHRPRGPGQGTEVPSPRQQAPERTSLRMRSTSSQRRRDSTHRLGSAHHRFGLVQRRRHGLWLAEADARPSRRSSPHLARSRGEVPERLWPRTRECISPPGPTPGAPSGAQPVRGKLYRLTVLASTSLF